MYLGKIKDLESKRAFMAQVGLLGYLLGNRSNKNSKDNVLGIFASALTAVADSLGFSNTKRIKAGIAAFKNELSNNDNDLVFELDEVLQSVERYIEHFSKDDDKSSKVDEAIQGKVWDKYSKVLENADNTTKKIVFFEIYNFAAPFNGTQYLESLSSKLGISKEVVNEMINTAQSISNICESLMCLVNED